MDAPKPVQQRLRKSAIRRLLRTMGRCRRSQQRGEEETSERIVAKWTRKVGIWTGVLVAVNVAADIIFALQLHTMNGQLNEAFAARRPWMYADLKIVDFDAADTVFTIAFSLKNTGATPALNVDVQMDTISQTNKPVGMPTQVFIHSAREQGKTYCETQRHQSDIHSQINVSNWFPGQTEPSNVTRKLPMYLNQRDPSGSFFSDIILYGCITYEFSFAKGERHQTRFMYQLPFVDLRKPVSVDNLKLTPLSGFDAD